MRSLTYGVILGLVLAGIVHISIILMIPVFATNDAWAKLNKIGEPWRFVDVSVVQTANDRSGRNTLLPSADPQFRIAACRFDLNETALRVRSNGNLPFWSAAVFDRHGNNIYSFNDRTAVNRQLDLVVVNPVQMAVIRQDPPDSLDSAVLVEAEIAQGIVLVRALAADNSWSAVLNNYVEEASCERFPL